MESLAPILHVANARATIDWYAKLGFEVESEHIFGPEWSLYVWLRLGSAQHDGNPRRDAGDATWAARARCMRWLSRTRGSTVPDGDGQGAR